MSKYKLGDFSDGFQELWFDNDFILVEQKSAEMLCNLLNNLTEENKQLRKDREELFIRERDTKNDWRELRQQLKELNIPINQIGETVRDCKGRTIGVYYDDS